MPCGSSECEGPWAKSVVERKTGSPAEPTGVSSASAAPRRRPECPAEGVLHRPLGHLKGDVEHAFDAAARQPCLHGSLGIVALESIALRFRLRKLMGVGRGRRAGGVADVVGVGVEARGAVGQALRRRRGCCGGRSGRRPPGRSSCATGRRRAAPERSIARLEPDAISPEESFP